MDIIGAKPFRPKIKEKRWNISEEKKLVEIWEKQGIYRFNPDPSDKRPIFAVDTPPPYASGPWHVGGAAHYAQIDMVGRYFRMRGYNVLMPFYADRNGLPVEVQVEKTTGLNPHELSRTPEGRRRFLELCRERLDEIEEKLVRLWRRMGCSFEYWRDGTDSETYRTVTQWTFIELWNRGLIYEDERPVNWCPRCKTTLADAELEYVERPTKLYYVVFKVKETGEDIVVATTRPELLNGCAAVIYNPSDTRYKHLKGMHAVVPLYGRVIPILESEEARPDFGTGLVMICSYGDQTDIRLFRNLGLKPRILIDRDGRMNEEAGFLRGLPVAEARARIADKLREEGLLVKYEEISHNIPVCWRCGTPIEFIHAKEYFLKQVDFKEDLKKISRKMGFYPEEHRVKLDRWIESVTTDWPISRDRYYATEVPVWRCRRCGAKLVPQPGRYYRPWIDEPPFERCPRCGAPKDQLVGEKKVFDTWFDSSISPLYMAHYKRNDDVFRRVFGNILRPQGYEIIRTWLYYTVLRVYQLTGKPAFRWVRISGMGLDEKGEAMHKSKGNVVDPNPYIERYGADAFRFWSAAASKLGSDYRFSEQLLKTGALYTTKLWNIARFISMFPEPREGEVKLRRIDRALLARLGRTVKRCIEAYEAFDVFEPINEIYSFSWDVFASHYLEAVKARAYNTDGRYSREEQMAAWYTLHRALRTILKVLAPIMPFVTDAIWRRLYSERGVHVELIEDPDEKWLSWSDEAISLLMEADATIWSYKKMLNLQPRSPVDAVLVLDERYEGLAEELRDMHRFADAVVSSEPVGEKIGNGVYVSPRR